MAFSLWRLIVLIVLNILVTLLHGCSLPKMDACNKQGESVVCKLSVSIADELAKLPPCVTKLKIVYGSLEIRTMLKALQNVSSLSDLSLEMNERFYYNYYDNYLLTLSDLNAINNLTVLRIRGEVGFQVQRDTFTSLTALHLLDLTETKRISLVNVVFGIQEMSKAPIHSLLLKNSQQIYSKGALSYNMSIDISMIICPLRHSLRVLDLSYNDLAAISLTKNCLHKLQHLDVSQNLFSYVVGDFNTCLLTIQWLESTKFGPNWQVGANQQNLLGDDHDIITNIDTEQASDITSSKKLSSALSFPYLSPAYAGMLHDIFVKNCGLSMISLIKCLPNMGSSQNICGILQCMFPEAKGCERGTDRFLAHLFGPICNYKDCLLKIPYPLPPSLKHIDAPHVRRSPLHASIPFDDGPLNLCIHPSNQLISLDFSNNIITVNEADKWANVGITGLNTLKVINFHDLIFPLLWNPCLFQDMPQLEELHVSGSSFLQAGNKTIPHSSFQHSENLKVLNMSRLNLVNIEHDAFVNNHKLEVLDLSKNDLSSNIYFNLSATRISFLNLSHNKIGVFSAEFRSNIAENFPLIVDLSNNPLLCNCETLDFISWLQSTHVNFTHFDSYQCFDASFYAIVKFDVSGKRLQCQRWREPVIATCSTFAVVFLVAFVAFLYKRRWHIHTLWFRLVVYFKQPRNNHQQNYLFDAFILYSSVDEDRLWVHYPLRNQLETEFGIKLCLHHRNFMPGSLIADNIEQAIKNSRRVVMIVSENFLRSQWCLEEVYMTTSIDLNKLVVVMFKDVFMLPVEIPYMIRHLLETRTYIEWNEDDEIAKNLFWHKLRRAILSTENVHPVSHRHRHDIEGGRDGDNHELLDNNELSNSHPT